MHNTASATTQIDADSFSRMEKKIDGLSKELAKQNESVAEAVAAANTAKSCMQMQSKVVNIKMTSTEAASLPLKTFNSVSRSSKMRKMRKRKENAILWSATCLKA